MDRVRFGRALGGGTREAARALRKAAAAAASPNPQPPSAIQTPKSAQKVAETIHQVRASSAGLKRGSKRFGEAVWAPTVKLSRVVWLEVTGVIFGLFAFAAAAQVWRHRGDLHASGDGGRQLIFAAIMLLFFGYFTLSNFIRANRR